MARVLLKDVQKRFGNVMACHIPYLEIGDGEFFTLLGPSGCGKTTTLRIIAGLTKEDSGEIYIGDQQVNDIPPERRNTAMVFQSYALFPHMTVFDNVAFGLRMRKTPNEEVSKRVTSALDMVGLKGMEKRYPKQLSGGQQQRVALARAVVCNPDVLLFDEPLSNLDAKLRERMRFELKKLQKELATTSIYVTHDQAEALVLSDRIVVMKRGLIVQLGTPDSIYRDPQSEFVADFIGLASFIEGEVIQAENETVLVETKDGLKIRCRGNVRKGSPVRVVVRPEHIELSLSDEWSGGNVFSGIIIEKAYLGGHIDYRVKIGKWTFRTTENPRASFEVGDEICCWLDPSGCVAIQKEGGDEPGSMHGMP